MGIEECNAVLLECESLLREARQLLDDCYDEYKHDELKIMRDKIDGYFGNRHLTSAIHADGENERPCNVIPSPHKINLSDGSY